MLDTLDVVLGHQQLSLCHAIMTSDASCRSISNAATGRTVATAARLRLTGREIGDRLPFRATHPSPGRPQWVAMPLRPAQAKAWCEDDGIDHIFGPSVPA
ncbi:hypothetical protein [Mesorhizobium sp. M0030]